MPNRAPARRHLLLAVFVGGAAGTALRVGLTELLPHGADQWPWATLLANVAGCLLLGWLTAGLVLGSDLDPRIHPLLATGLCGGLTTFSAYQVELVLLLDAGHGALAASYLTASVAAGIAAVLAGRALAGLTHPAGARP